MADIKMVLADMTEIVLTEFTLPMHAVLTCADEDEMVSVWKLLTPDNLSAVEIKSDDETVYIYTSCELEGQQSMVNPDGTLTVHFYMNGTHSESEYETVAKILLGEA